MKILFTCLALMSVVGSFCLTQVRMQPLSSAMIKSNPENVVFTSNESHAIIVGAFDIRPGVLTRTISVTNLLDLTSNLVEFKTTTSDDADLFGHHITESSFVFFENIYDAKQQTSSVVLHELDLRTFELKQHDIYKDKKAFIKPQFRFVNNANSPTSALYSLAHNRNRVLAEVYFLTDNFKIQRTETAEFKASLDASYDWKLEMNSVGELLMIHKQLPEGKGSTIFYHFMNKSKTDGAEESLGVLFSHESTQIEDVKIHLNDESLVEFTALSIENRGQVARKNVLFITFNPAKGAPISETSFELKIGNNPRLHTFLPLNEKFSIVITKSDQIGSAQAAAARTVSDLSANNRSDRHAKQVLTIFYIHNQKGVLHQNMINLDFDYTKLGDKIYSEQAFDYSFWSDGRVLFALHNTMNPHDAQSETSNIITRGSEENQSKSVLMPSLSYFIIDSGLSKESESIPGVRMNQNQLLPSTFQIHSTKMAVVLAQTEQQVFVPVKISFQ